MTKDSLSAKGFLGAAVLALLGAGLLPACGSSGARVGVGGAGGAGGTVGAGGALGLCPLNEPEPNDTRDTPTPYVLGSTVVACIGSDLDVDMYAFTAPATDPAGGYVVLSFSQVGVTGALDVQLDSATDNSKIGEIYKVNEGTSINGYLAVAPGHTYRIAVSQFTYTKVPFRYTMTATYTATADFFEPNDTKATAKPIGVGTAINAYQSAGYVTDTYSGDSFADWYSVVLAAGPPTIKFIPVPTDIPGDLSLFDPAGEKVGEMYTLTQGADVTLMADVAVAGTYTISLVPFGGGPLPADEITGAAIPDHFTRPYTLLVTQP